MRYLSPRNPAVEHEQRVGLVVTFLLFFSCTDFFSIVLGSEFPSGPTKYVFSILLLGFACFHVRYVLRAAFGAPELTALLLLAMLSTLWSLDPAQTFERSIQIWATSLFAMALAAMLSLRSLTLLLAFVMGLTMIGSLIVVAVLPEARGTEQWPTAWRGLFGHKNGLGANSVFCLILLAAAISMSNGWKRQIFNLMFAVALLLLLASESRTSQLVGGFSALALLAAAASRGQIRVWMVLFLTIYLVAWAVLLVALFSGLADPLFEAIGRRPTLSNRIPLWEAIWPEVMRGFWTGYGFSSYWDPESARVMRIERIPLLGFLPHYSHNGLVETLLNTGVAGVVLVLATLGRAVTGVSVVLRAPSLRFAGAALLVLIAAFLMFNLTESFILNVNTFSWTVFVAVTTKLGLVLQQRSRRGARVQRAPSVGADPRHREGWLSGA